MGLWTYDMAGRRDAIISSIFTDDRAPRSRSINRNRAIFSGSSSSVVDRPTGCGRSAGIGRDSRRSYFYAEQ